LTLAVVMNRVDLVKLLIEHGADVRRTGYLGRLDDQGDCTVNYAPNSTCCK
jgi:hypothetical protein